MWIIEYTLKAIYQQIVTVLGWFFIPFYLFSVESFDCSHVESRPNVKFKNSWFDSFFGNSEDGLDGDVPYKAKYRSLNWWTRYNWCAFRNPIHNLALRQGVNEVIIDYVWKGNRYTEDRIGHEGYCYSTAMGASGKEYKMFRWCKLLFGNCGIEFNFGYKNFNIQEVNQRYQYSFTVSFNPLKKFES